MPTHFQILSTSHLQHTSTTHVIPPLPHGRAVVLHITVALVSARHFQEDHFCLADLLRRFRFPFVACLSCSIIPPCRSSKGSFAVTCVASGLYVLRAQGPIPVFAMIG